MAVRAGSARTSLFHSLRSRLFAKNVTLGKYLERIIDAWRGRGKSWP